MELNRSEVIMPGGIELAFEAESYLDLNPSAELLSVACGTGEIELYYARKYACQVVGIDTSENFISKAQSKAERYEINQIAKFLVGDGNNLEFPDECFDVVFCSGAICEFYYSGLKEFYRVLKSGGKAVIIEVVWTTKEIPNDVKKIWAGDTADIFTEEDNNRILRKNNFRVVFSHSYDEPSWWEAYYDDRGPAPRWEEERSNYRSHKKYLALGLFVIEKT
ncbi:MAG: class I SAM-dependent methyltransferase [Candidatus Kariarchaeaceae archaeon]|jgi:SAM-dependent methyltransferase